MFHGDTIYAQSTVTDKRETSDGEHVVVTMHVETYKIVADGEDELVCELDRTVLSEKHPDR